MARNNTWFVDEDTPIIVDAADGVLANDADPEGDPLTAVLDTNVTHGALNLGPDGAFTYTPAQGYVGLDAFTYHAHDGTSASNVVTVTFRIVVANHAPIANDDAFTTPADTPLVAGAPGVLVNDVEVEGEAMHVDSYDRVSAAGGTVALGQDGGFTYTPTPGYNGIDTFTYRAGDPNRFVDNGQWVDAYNSVAVSLGDLDGDGDLDAFVVNYDQPSRVWLNNGDGMYYETGQAIGRSNSEGVSLGDVDGDGDLDAFVANYNQANRVWLNNGSGTFSDSGQALGRSPSYDVSLGDLDGDGDLDAFVANGGANRVWLNNGDGTFSDSGQALGGSNSYGVSLGDVDGDGDLDAFIANYNQANRVWLNNGSGTFFDSGQALGSASSRGVSLGDLDGDGDLDAFVANDNGQADRVWLNSGSGTFSDSGQAFGSSNSRGVSLGDLDNDGDLDVFVANGNTQANRVWLNNGSGTFSDSGQALGSSSSYGVSLGDLDGDGALDAFVANIGANGVWLNNGDGTFSGSRQGFGSSFSRGVSLGDLDSDGDLDAFVANLNGQGNSVWLNNSSGTFSDSRQALGSSESFGVSLGDLDGDGDLDAFVANFNGQGNRVWLNNGGGTFSDSGQALGSSNSYGVNLGDLDGDGDLDAFVANFGQANRVWLNSGSGTFSDSGQALESSNSRGVSLGDVDGDGDLDAFVANDNGQADRVWLNNGSGTFSDSGQALGNSNSYGVSLGDLDGDGDLDAYVANFGQANRVWLNNGSGAFSGSGQALGTSNSHGVSLGDVDGDGDLDAFVANSNAQADRVWLNSGSGTFSDSGQALGSSESWGVSLGDLDGDGDPDVLVASFNQPKRVWLNTPTVSAPATVTITVGTANAPPVITSNGGGPTASISVPENQTSVATVTSTDPENDPRTYTVTGGADAAKFSINGSSGVLTFVNPPDFESPTDAGANNTYVVVVTATATGGSDAQTITVTITNVNEAPSVSAGGPYTVDEGAGVTLTANGSDPDGDALVYSWDLDNDGSYNDGTGQTVTFNGDDGPRVQAMGVRAQDPLGLSGAAVGSVSVANLSPSFRTPNPPTQAPSAAEYTYDADMIEPGPTDVLSWNLTTAPAGMTIDPTATCGLTPTHTPTRCRKLRWSPTPTQLQQATPYNVVLEVTDDDGGSTRLSWAIDANPVDTDGGGASDSCELTYNLNPNDPADDIADPDGDGLLTRDECLAGTDPTASNTPTAPTPYAPLDDAVVNASAVTLTVDNATDPDGDALFYVFEVIERGSNRVVYSTPETARVTSGASRTQTTVTDDPANLAIFREDGRYRWHAAAWDGRVYGPASADGSFVFSLDDGVPSAPIPVSPVGVTSSLSPTLTVDNATDPEGEALTLEFELLDNATFDPIDGALAVPQGAGLTTGWAVTVPLADGEAYRWRARATDGRQSTLGTGPWSEWAIFEVDTAHVALAAPSLLAPVNGEEVASDGGIMVTWGNVADPDGGAVVYRVDVREEADPAVVVFTAEGLAAAQGESTSVDVGALGAGTYLWRVMATAGANASDWSETWTFLVRTPDTGDDDDAGTDTDTNTDSGGDADDLDADDLDVQPDAVDDDDAALSDTTEPDSDGTADGTDARQGISLGNTTFGCATTPAAPLSTGDLVLALLGLIGLVVGRRSFFAKRKGV